MEFERATGAQRGKGQNEVAHHQFHCDAIKQAANQRMFDQEMQSTAGAVVDGCYGSGDEEMQNDAERIDPWAVKMVRTEQTSGNTERDPPSEQNAGLRQV